MSEDRRYLRLCEAFQYIDDVFLDLVEQEKTEGKKKVRKSVRIVWSTAAACLCMLILLPAAALAYNWFGLRDLLLPEREKMPDSFTLSVYQESPVYQAAAEWQAFLAEYDVDHRILFEAEKEGFTAENESWKLYGVYSQEMGEKLNAIADKYELRLHTGGRTIKRILWEPLVTESFLAGSSTEDGFLYEDSSFRYKGSIELAGYGRVEFAFVYAVKGSFQEVLPFIEDAAAYREWRYETAGGEFVQLALGSRNALILAEAERSIAVVMVSCGAEDGVTEEVLQVLADRIDFYTLWGIHMSELGASSTSGDRISLSGYQESPEAKALAEWRTFCAGYDTDGKILSALGNGVFVAEGREDWSLYGGIYSYEMGEKLDEIVSRYGLKLHTELNVINPQELEYRVGGSFLRDCAMYWGYIYENGTFHTEGDAELEGCGIAGFQFERSVKGTFEEMYLNIGRAEDYKDWQYVSAGGEPLMLALGPGKALIFGDFEECFITVNVLLGSDDGMTEEDLQELADRIDFGILKDVQVLSGACAVGQDTSAAGEEMTSQPENEQQPENTSEIVFFGSWQVTDYRASRIYALSQEEIEEFLTYGIACYEDAFFLNGTPVEVEDIGYVSMDYTKEEVEEQFNIDMTDWWNEDDTIAYIGIISAESDESPSLRYCFGTEFFVIDSDTIWIYYEGVFFRAERAGA